MLSGLALNVVRIIMGAALKYDYIGSRLLQHAVIDAALASIPKTISISWKSSGMQRFVILAVKLVIH